MSVPIRTARCETVPDLLDQFHRAAAEADLAKYFGTFHTLSSRFLGTDASENWTVEEFYDYSKPHFRAGKAWTYVPRPSSRTIQEHDDRGMIVTFDELLDSASFVATTRGTGLAVFDPVLRYWFIAQYHLSFPTPNHLATRICNVIALSEKSERMGGTDAEKIAKAEEAAAQLLAELELEEAGGAKGKGAKKKKGGKA